MQRPTDIRSTPRRFNSSTSTLRRRIDQRTLLASGRPVNECTVLGDHQFEQVQPVEDLLQIRNFPASNQDEPTP